MSDEGHQAGSVSIRQEEVEFYELARHKEPPFAALACFGTAVDDAAQSAVILLEDKRDDCYTTEWPLPPKIEDCERAVTALATIHATWWNSPALANDEFDHHNDPIVNLSIERSRRFIALFFDTLGDRLSKSRRAIIEQLYEHYPRVTKHRLSETNTQTLVHGDAHFWNVLFPKDESRTPIWIDWQTWGVDFGALDLAHMIALFWFPERREWVETRLLKTYLAELNQRGVDYDYDELTYDYRLQAAGQLFVPIAQWHAKTPAWIWWPNLERAFSAFDDLDCNELLDN